MVATFFCRHNLYKYKECKNPISSTKQLVDTEGCWLVPPRTARQRWFLCLFWGAVSDESKPENSIERQLWLTAEELEQRPDENFPGKSTENGFVHLADIRGHILIVTIG